MKTQQKDGAISRFHPYTGLSKMARSAKSSAPKFPLAFLKKSVTSSNLFKRKSTKCAVADSENVDPSSTNNMFNSPSYGANMNLMANAFKFEMNKEIDNDMPSFFGTPAAFTKNNCTEKDTQISSQKSLPSAVPDFKKATAAGLTPKITNPRNLMFGTPDVIFQSVGSKLFAGNNTPVRGTPASAKRKMKSSGGIFKRRKTNKAAKVPGGGRNLYLELQREKQELQKQQGIHMDKVETRSRVSDVDRVCLENKEQQRTPLKFQSASSNLKSPSQRIDIEESVVLDDVENMYSFDSSPFQPLRNPMFAHIKCDPVQVSDVSRTSSKEPSVLSVKDLETTASLNTQKSSTENLKKFWSSLAAGPVLNHSNKSEKERNSRGSSITSEESDMSIISKDIMSLPATPMTLPPLSATPVTPAQGDLGVLMGESGDSDLSGTQFSALVAQQARTVTCRCHISSNCDDTTKCAKSSAAKLRTPARSSCRTASTSPYTKIIQDITPKSKGPCLSGGNPELSPIAAFDKTLSPVLLPMCCRWAEDRKERMKMTQEVLESTRIPEQEDAEVHTTRLPAIPQQSRRSSSSQPPDLVPSSAHHSHHHMDTIPESGPEEDGDDEAAQLEEDDYFSDHLSVLEYSSREMSWYGGIPDRQTEKTTQAYKGQLKLAVYVNSGLLTVHVMQARHLVSRFTGNCNSYVKVGVIPDDYCQSRSKTMLVKETNHPVYDEKFSFELVPEDMAKRVFICVCHKDRKRQTVELLGCMSFGINNIRRKRKDVNGWFYLLAESVGQRKHLQVASDNCHDNTRLNAASSEPTSSPWEPQQENQNLRVLLQRSRLGYGFSLTGACPPSVCRVDPGGPAHIAGVKKGDYLLKVNGESVSTASSEQSGRIIRHCSNKVVLEFLRAGSHCNPRSSLWQPSRDDLDSDTDSDDSVIDESMDGGQQQHPGGYWGDKENMDTFSPLPPRPVKEGAKRVRFQDFH